VRVNAAVACYYGVTGCCYLCSCFHSRSSFVAAIRSPFITLFVVDSSGRFICYLALFLRFEFTCGFVCSFGAFTLSIVGFILIALFLRCSVTRCSVCSVICHAFFTLHLPCVTVAFLGWVYRYLPLAIPFTLFVVYSLLHCCRVFGDYIW